MTIRKLALTAALILCARPAWAEDAAYSQYTNPLQKTTHDFLIKYKERLETIGLLQMCGEKSLLEKLDNQNLTGADIEKHFRDKTVYPGLTEDRIRINTAIVASFLAGYSTGFASKTAEQATSEKKQNKACHAARAWATAALYGNDMQE